MSLFCIWMSWIVHISKVMNVFSHFTYIGWKSSINQNKKWSIALRKHGHFTFLQIFSHSLQLKPDQRRALKMHQWDQLFHSCFTNLLARSQLCGYQLTSNVQSFWGRPSNRTYAKCRYRTVLQNTCWHEIVTAFQISYFFFFFIYTVACSILGHNTCTF